MREEIVVRLKCLIFDLGAKFYRARLSKPAASSSPSNHHNHFSHHRHHLCHHHIPNRLLHDTQENQGNRIPSGQGNTLNSLKPLLLSDVGNAYFQSLDWVWIIWFIKEERIVTTKIDFVLRFWNVHFYILKRLFCTDFEMNFTSEAIYLLMNGNCISTF